MDQGPQSLGALPGSRSKPYSAWVHDEPPAGRTGSSMVYDPTGNAIYLFGGYPLMPSSDLWKYDVALGSWEEIFYKDGPVNRTGHGMTFDPVNGEIIIWGGIDHNYAPMNDMWRYSVASGLWTEIVQTNRPPARYAMEIEYDKNQDFVYLYGGYNSMFGRVYNELYEFNVSSGAWSIVSTLDGIGRYDYSMDIDTQNDTLYIFGGWNNSVGGMGDLLEIKLAATITYNKYSAGTPGPLRETSIACLDSTGDKPFVYIFGGYSPSGQMMSDLWSFSTLTKTFSFVGNYSTNPGFPQARESSAYCYVHSTDRFFIYSGRDLNGYFENLWYFDHSAQAWTKTYTAPLRPETRESMGFVASLENKRMYLFGGLGYTQRDDTWYYDMVSKSWSSVSVSSKPLNRFGHTMAYDPVGGGIYLFGGYTWYTMDNWLNDLWYFDMDTQDWSLILPAGTWPANRSNAQSVVDPATGHFYVYGGMLGDTAYSDLWKFDPFGVSWSEVSDINAPVKRYGHAMALDPNGGGFFMFGGGFWNSGSGFTQINNELWRYDFSTKTWTQQGGTQPPMQLHGRMASGEDKLFFFGGITIGSFNLMNDLYVYNISQGFWAKLPKQGQTPYPRFTHGVAFDPWERDVYVFGGYGNSGGLWSYGLPYDQSIDLNFTQGPVCYARYKAYDLRVDVEHGLSFDLVDTVSLIIDPADLNITMEYDADQDKFIILGTAFNYLDISSSSAANDGIKSWAITFRPNFEWAFPKTGPLDIRLRLADKNGFVIQRDLANVLSVETGVEYDGALEVSSQSKGRLVQGSVLTSGEEVHWGGIRVVYAGTTDFYPPDSEFDVVVFDDDGDFWIDASSSGRNISIDTTADITNDPSDVHFLNLTGDASNVNILTIPFELKVDTQVVAITDLKPDNDAWLRQNSVTFTAKITDKAGLVNASSIEYNLSSVPGGDGKWTSAGYDTDAAVIDASAKLTLSEGAHTLRWRATDQAGNSPIVSDEVVVKIDTVNPELVDFYPGNGAVVNTPVVTAWAAAADATSGIGPSGVQYQLSTDGGTTFSDWTPIAGSAGAQVNRSVELNLSSTADNHIHWRVLDAAGNLVKTPAPVIVKVVLPSSGDEIPPVTLLTPDNKSVVKTLTPSFTWDTGTYGGTDDVYYHFYLRKDPDPASQPPDARNLVKESHTITYELEDGATYYWTVLPVINGKLGKCTNGPFSFTTSYLVDLNREITFTLEVENLKVKQNGSYTINLTVANTGELTETIELAIIPGTDCPDMVELGTKQLTIMPGNSKVVQITIEPAGDCPTEIFVYTIRGTFDAGTVSKELTLVVESEHGSTGGDDDDSGVSGAFVAVLLIVLLIIIVLIVIVIVVLMRRGSRSRGETAQPEPASTKSRAADSGKKTSGRPPEKPKEAPVEEAPLEDYDEVPYTLASPDALEAEMEAGGDIFQEAAYHKGYDDAKRKEYGDDGVLDLTSDFPPPDQLSIEGNERTEIKGWDMPELDPTNMPGAGAPILALPPAVFLDMEDAGKGRSYRVEEVLVMGSDGILLTHFSRGSAINVDEDILAGMITAIQSFVKESFSTSGKGLSDLAMGDFRIFISQGKLVTFVAMVSGEGYSGIKGQLDMAIKDTEQQFGATIDDWNGDLSDMAGIEHIIRDFLDGKYE